jgi:C_GCAxxG_C_C family probable redox protein
MSFEPSIMSKVQKAVAIFRSGFNCSQALLRTYGPDYDVSPLHAVQIAAGFGGGMRRGDTCGAVTGALMVLGLRYGPRQAQDASAKDTVYPKVREFSRRFEDRCGSVVCRDLLGSDIGTPEGMKHAKEEKLFETVCPQIVQVAAEILEEMF